MQHASLAQGGWGKLSLVEQMANIGSEVGRGANWAARDPDQSRRSLERALELIDLTLADRRWRGRFKEIARIRDVVAAQWLGETAYTTTCSDLDEYFLQFGIAARSTK
ncbi:MAG: hypothetical protein A2666_04055 [Parcubacteria group bacterium RIFCSPHIGHO2_01_FULL_47_10b]|nr:MAG: hypothetical protein A2666_04055 [Parcubacteria group bacterium RIFCSPHIGHO2_01_FULL_47_10b]